MRECERHHRGIPCLYRDYELTFSGLDVICLQPYCVNDLVEKPSKRTGKCILKDFVNSLNNEDKAELNSYLKAKYDKR